MSSGWVPFEAPGRGLVKRGEIVLPDRTSLDGTFQDLTLLIVRGDVGPQDRCERSRNVTAVTEFCT
jgi:hypothetical protein